MADDTRLQRALAEARALGFLGPGAIERHIEHGLTYLPLLASGGRCLDLGSGGGVPGLVLAAATPELSWVLLDVSRRRTSFLARVVSEFGWSERVHVLRRSADDAAREPGLRGAFGTVVARSFGPPALTAECAAGFLQVGGRLVASEPPGGRPERWPATELAALGFGGPTLAVGGEFSIVSCLLERGCPDTHPRPWPMMRRRPLWNVPRETVGNPD